MHTYLAKNDYAMISPVLLITRVGVRLSEPQQDFVQLNNIGVIQGSAHTDRHWPK